MQSDRFNTPKWELETLMRAITWWTYKWWKTWKTWERVRERERERGAVRVHCGWCNEGRLRSDTDTRHQILCTVPYRFLENWKAPRKLKTSRVVWTCPTMVDKNSQHEKCEGVTFQKHYITQWKEVIVEVRLTFLQKINTPASQEIEISEE